MIAALACVVALASGAPGDVGAQPLAPFSVVTAAGATVDGNQLIARGRPLVIYLVPGSETSTRFVAALRQWWLPDWNDRVVVVLGGAPEASRQWWDRAWGDGEQPAWFADTDGGAAAALQLRGTVAIAAITAGRVDWKIDGVIADPAALQPAMKAWIEGAGR